MKHKKLARTIQKEEEGAKENRPDFSSLPPQEPGVSNALWQAEALAEIVAKYPHDKELMHEKLKERELLILEKRREAILTGALRALLYDIQKSETGIDNGTWHDVVKPIVYCLYGTFGMFFMSHEKFEYIRDSAGSMVPLRMIIPKDYDIEYTIKTMADNAFDPAVAAVYGT